MNKFINKIMSKVNVIGEPMTKFSKIPFVASLTNGMISSVGITMIGSLFMVAWLFCTDGNITEKALIPFLKPWANDLLLVNQLTMGIMALYIVVSMGGEYAEAKGISRSTGSLGALMSFILLNYNTIGKIADIASDGSLSAGVDAIPINFWGGAGIVTAIIATAISVNVVYICYKHNIRIKMPDSVPDAIADTFSAIIPYFLITIICWSIRTLMNIDIPTLIGEILMPILSAADNIFIFTFTYCLDSLLWSCGLHGDNIVGAVTNTFTNTWMIENNAAAATGQAIPHIWVPNLCRLFMWVSSCWPLLFYMVRSSNKLPHLKSVAALAAPGAIFSIAEPIMFGLPLVLNPFLMIPFILAHTVTGALTYFLTEIGFIGKMYIALPWATPTPLLGYLSTGGSIGAFIIVVINFLIGLAIFYPFWKVYEKNEIEKLERLQNEQLGERE